MLLFVKSLKLGENSSKSFEQTLYVKITNLDKMRKSVVYNKTHIIQSFTYYKKFKVALVYLLTIFNLKFSFLKRTGKHVLENLEDIKNILAIFINF